MANTTTTTPKCTGQLPFLVYVPDLVFCESPDLVFCEPPGLFLLCEPFFQLVPCGLFLREIRLRPSEFASQPFVFQTEALIFAA